MNTYGYLQYVRNDAKEFTCVFSFIMTKLGGKHFYYHHLVECCDRLNTDHSKISGTNS